MRLRCRRRAAASAVMPLIACALLVGCGGQPSGNATRVQLGSAAMPGKDPGVSDPEPSLLAEPKLTGNAELFAKVAEIGNLCNTFPDLAKLKQPAPFSLDEQMEYASVYYNILSSIDPDKQIDDKQAPAHGSRKRPLSDLAKQSLATERREMYAYLVRLTYARDLRDQGMNTARETHQRMQNAWAALASDAYDVADSYLVNYEVNHCA